MTHFRLAALLLFVSQFSIPDVSSLLISLPSTTATVGEQLTLSWTSDQSDDPQAFAICLFQDNGSPTCLPLFDINRQSQSSATSSFTIRASPGLYFLGATNAGVLLAETSDFTLKAAPSSSSSQTTATTTHTEAQRTTSSSLQTISTISTNKVATSSTSSPPSSGAQTTTSSTTGLIIPSSSPLSSTATPLPSTTDTTPASSQDASSKTSPIPIILGVIIPLVLVILGVILWCMRRRRSRKSTVVPYTDLVRENDQPLDEPRQLVGASRKPAVVPYTDLVREKDQPVHKPRQPGSVSASDDQTTFTGPSVNEEFRFPPPFYNEKSSATSSSDGDASSRTVPLLPPPPSSPRELPTPRQLQILNRVQTLSRRLPTPISPNPNPIPGPRENVSELYHQALEEIQRQREEISWWRDQYNSEWALGLTDELPPEYGTVVSPRGAQAPR